MRCQLVDTRDVVAARRQQGTDFFDAQRAPDIAERCGIADQQQPNEYGERIAFLTEGVTCGRFVVAGQCHHSGGADALDHTIDRVRRTAQRVGDALRRFGVYKRGRQGIDAVSTAGFSLPKPTARRLLMTTAPTMRPRASTPTMMRTAVFSCGPCTPYFTTVGAMSSATRFITLMSGLSAGPAVSLNGSPTVSPMTVAACASEPLPP